MPKTKSKPAPRTSTPDPVPTAVEAIREAMHEVCKDMPPAQFKEVLEEISADIDGHLEALKEEGLEDDE